MKKTLFFLIFLILVSGVFSQTVNQLDKMLEFDYDLPDFGNLDQDSVTMLVGKYFVIYASVLETAVTNRDEDTFQATVTVIRGVWEDIDKITMYKGELIFSGPEFFRLIPARPPRNVTPKMIVPNKNLTVLCKLVEIKTEGNLIVPVFEVHKIRYRN